VTSIPLQRLLDKHQFPLLTLETFDDWIAARADVLLFFSGDPARFPESSDVAVILPELMERFRGRIEPAVIGAEAEQALQQRYRFETWPSLVMLRQGHYVGAISRVRSWAEYLDELERLLQAPPARAPGIGIPVVASVGSA
jgi:hydrogenase-1 operon protein HyaE